MKCEYFEGCPVYAKHGPALCARLFCADRCPETQGQGTGHSVQGTAVKQKAAVKRGKH